jgi:hypothetical protein
VYSSELEGAVFFQDCLATARDGFVYVHGWTQSRASAALELISRAVVTDGKPGCLVNPPGSVITTLALTEEALNPAMVDAAVLIFKNRARS